MKLSSELPLYESIRRELKARIENGELSVGTRILPEIELAKQVGVSRSTARKALQALEVEGLITRTAGRGSFVTAPSATNSRPHHSKGALAITVNDVERYNHAGQIVQGFMNAGAMNGYHTAVHPPNSMGMDEFDYLLSVRRSAIDGWALWLNNASEKNISLLQNFRKSGCALVLVDRYVRELECDFVVTKNREMGQVLTRELIKRGHTEIGVVSFPFASTVEQERYDGYVQALREADIPLQQDLLVVDHMQGLDALRMQMLTLLGRRKRPTAIFCASEYHAPVVLGELDRLGYTVPADIEVALIDDNRFIEQVDTPVISVAQRSYEIGKEACEILQQRIQNPGMPLQQRFLDFKLNFNPVP